MWQDDVYKDKVLKAREYLQTDAEYKERRSKQMLELWQDPEYQQAVYAGHAALWEDNDERRQQVAERTRKMWQNPEKTTLEFPAFLGLKKRCGGKLPAPGD